MPEETPMTDTIKPVAYGSRNADGDIWMLHFDAQEARTYCDKGMEPASLVDTADVVALVRQMRDALAGIDEAYCRAGSPLTRDERTEDRKRLIAVRDAFADAEAFLAQQEAPRSEGPNARLTAPDTAQRSDDE